MQATRALKFFASNPVLAGQGHKKIGKDLAMKIRKQEKAKSLKEKRDEQQYKGRKTF
jgi:hypothetical protein